MCWTPTQPTASALSLTPLATTLPLAAQTPWSVSGTSMTLSVCGRLQGETVLAVLLSWVVPCQFLIIFLLLQRWWGFAGQQMISLEQDGQAMNVFLFSFFLSFQFFSVAFTGLHWIWCLAQFWIYIQWSFCFQNIYCAKDKHHSWQKRWYLVFTPVDFSIDYFQTETVVVLFKQSQCLLK